MSCIDLHSALEPQTLVSCQNCSWTGLASHLHAIRDLATRIAPGETVPAGQCPDCGALAHLHAPRSSVSVEVFALASDTRDGTEVFAGTRQARADLLRERFLGKMLKASVPMAEPVELPHNPTPAQIEDDLALHLLEQGFYDVAPRISVRVADYASVSVAVSGAVFEPHGVEIGGSPGDQIDVARQSALGASTEARNLSAALRNAGGVRPDADLSAVSLYRGGQKYQLDLTGVFQGRNMVDIMLLSGDEIVVPSRLCFQDDLMRPSPVSPPGITLFMSNLTQPATGNAPSAVGRSVREVPYGTRFMQAVFDTNCVGGVRATSARRSALLFTRDPMTGVSIVIERSIEDQLRRADRDDFDPYVLPGDSIACYDSGVTNVADVARVLGLVSGIP